MKLFASFWILAVLLSSRGIIPGSSFASLQSQKNQQDEEQTQNQNKDPNKHQPPAGAPISPAPAPQSETPAPQESLPVAKPPETSPPTQNPGQQKSLRKKKRVRKKATTGSQSGKVVVRNGGAKGDSPQLSPGMTQEQALHQRENTNQLLATTDANLKRIAGRQLNAAQQSTLDQIHSYLRQAKAASDAGDVARAHTLAFKAHLLSDELAGK
jgi:hypothetical protein